MGSESLSTASNFPSNLVNKDVRISVAVIKEIAVQALERVIGVKPAGTFVEFEAEEAVKIDVDDGKEPSIGVDVHIETKYGLRIPDISWYVQESMKSTLEQNTGYTVKHVNVFVQGVYLE